jgi:hypothetical protein
MTSTKYIGLDVHKESISIAVLNFAGKVVMECVIETKASTILQFIHEYRLRFGGDVSRRVACQASTRPSREQLKNRFGYTRTLDEATPYLRGCYSTPGDAGQVETRGKREDVAFLRDSPWMVVIENKKAVDLILCKGY